MIQRLKTLLTTRQKIAIKQTINVLQLRFATLFSAHPLLSSVYYLLFSTQFRREHFSVLKGKVAYHQSLIQTKNSSTLIRRNIHRLEKGLIMQPRKKSFAEDYIAETVKQLTLCYVDLDTAELKWAFDVLTKYFSIVERTSIIDAAYQRFEVIRDSIHSTLTQASLSGSMPFNGVSSQSVPYRYQELPQARLSFEQLYGLFQRRRSVRFYLDKPVDESLVTQAIDAASLAPSACNRQPYRFHRLHGKDAVIAAGFAMGTTGFSHQVPYLLVVTGDLSAYPAERDRHVIYIDAALASMQLMLALDTLGLASCPINWPDIEARERLLSSFLQLPAYERPIMLIACGYADPQGGIPFSQKKSAIDLSKSHSISQ